MSAHVNVSEETFARVMRLVPDHGSGETIRGRDIADQLGLRYHLVSVVLGAAVKRGLAVRVRAGAFCRAPQAEVRP